MFFTAWQKGLRKRMSSTSPGRPLTKARPKSCRPRLEVLEDRFLLSSYSIVDLGGFTPSAINNAGVLAGTAANGHAALWQNGTIQDLGTLGGASSYANDINNLGQAVGVAQTSSGSQPFLWDSAQGMRGLGASGTPYGVNDASQVVGSINGSNIFSAHAFFWDSAHGLKDLGTFGGTSSWARAINQAGQVTGWVENRSNGTTTGYGYVWDSATGSFTRLSALPGYAASRAYDINNAGQVIGYSGFFIPGPLHIPVFSPRATCLWQNGVVTNLSMPSVRAINNNGQVVGGKYLRQSSGLIDLSTQIDPSLGWTFDINSVVDINDAGQIVGQGTLNSQPHSFLMSPTDANQAVGFTVTGFPSPTTAGVAGSFTVTATNRSGTTATGYTGTVQFASSDAQAVLPGAYTFTAADAGVHTFSATLKTAGTQSITAKDTVTATIAGSQAGISVTPAAASRLSITGPSSVSAGAAFSITVTALDPYGNVATGYTGSVHFDSSDSSATLPADYTFTAADYGVPTFTGLILRQQGTQTISVTDTLDSTLSDSLSVNVI